MSFFKRLFGMHKASKDQSDTKIDFEVKDIKKGYLLDYDLKSWEVEEVSVYTWDNGIRDYEYTISDNGKKLFINYETANQNLSVYWAGKINEIWNEGKRKMRLGKPMEDESFIYNGKTYYYYAEGAARVKSSTEVYDMMNWLFQSDDEESFISFNKYSDNSFEAYIGKPLPAHAISNILPR